MPYKISHKITNRESMNLEWFTNHFFFITTRKLSILGKVKSGQWTNSFLVRKTQCICWLVRGGFSLPGPQPMLFLLSD